MSEAAEVIRGDTCVIEVTVYDEDGALLDLTGYSAEFAVKLKVSDPDPPVLLLAVGTGITFLNQVTLKGQMRIVIEKEDTNNLPAGNCWYDLHIATGALRHQVIKNTILPVITPVNRL